MSVSLPKLLGPCMQGFLANCNAEQRATYDAMAAAMDLPAGEVILLWGVQAFPAVHEADMPLMSSCKKGHQQESDAGTICQ